MLSKFHLCVDRPILQKHKRRFFFYSITLVQNFCSICANLGLKRKNSFHIINLHKISVQTRNHCKHWNIIRHLQLFHMSGLLSVQHVLRTSQLQVKISAWLQWTASEWPSSQRECSIWNGCAEITLVGGDEDQNEASLTAETNKSQRKKSRHECTDCSSNLSEDFIRRKVHLKLDNTCEKWVFLLLFHVNH